MSGPEIGSLCSLPSVRLDNDRHKRLPAPHRIGVIRPRRASRIAGALVSDDKQTVRPVLGQMA